MTRRQIAPRSRAWRQRIALLAAIVVLPALAACEPDQLNAAAIVDDEKITVTEIQGALEAVEEAQERLGLPTERLPQAAHNEVHRRVIVLIYAKAAAEAGIDVTEGEMALRAAELRRQAGGDEAFERTQLSYGKTLAVAEDDTRLQLIESKMVAKFSADAGRELQREEAIALIGERLIATARSMEIRVNPRYGTFDPVRGSIDPFKYDYIRDPAGTTPAPVEP